MELGLRGRDWLVLWPRRNRGYICEQFPLSWATIPRCLVGGGRFQCFDVFGVEVETRPAEIISVWTKEEAGWHPERLYLLDGIKVDDGRDG